MNDGFFAAWLRGHAEPLSSRTGLATRGMLWLDQKARAESSRIVAGPSLTNSTCIIA